MLPITSSYDIFPSVMPTDRCVKMTVAAAERAFIFQDGREYSVKIISVDSDENYYSPNGYEMLSVEANGGTLSFDFTFVGEGERTVELILEDKVIATFTVYALDEDLYKLRPLKGDLHSHSYRSDGSRDPAAQAGHYREQGYDFVALTDHNRYYSGGEIDEAYEGVNTGLVRIFGEEVHSPGSVVHIVHVGGKRSVAERYVCDRENYDSEILEYISKVPSEVPEELRSRYGAAMWATDEIHKAGGIAIFPHPFWRPGSSRTYNLKSEYARIFLGSGMFDAYELVGAMTQPDINRSVALWGDLRAKGCKIRIVGSSDAHVIDKATHFPNYFTVCFAREKEQESILNAIKEGMSVAVEATGDEYQRQYRAYGEFRLVSYAQFLLRNYFPHLQRLASGAGIAMREYAMDRAGAEIISAYTDIADSFSDKFFGRGAPKLPSEKILAFEEKWRAVQQSGPKTRGSSVDAAPAKSLI